MIIRGDLVLFHDKAIEDDDDPYWNAFAMGPPYDNKLGLVLRPGGYKSSYVYFFGLEGTDQRVWNLSHHYLKVVSVAD